MKKVLFIVGPHASGKTYSTMQYLNENNIQDIVVVDTGPIMRQLHKSSNLELSIDDWVFQLENKYGKDITSKMITQEIERIILKGNYENAILIGFRTVETIQYVISKLQLNDFNILFVDASLELLYSNYSSREIRNVSLDFFEVYLKKELLSGLGELKNYVLQNNNFKYFYKKTNNDSFEDYILNYFGCFKSKNSTRLVKNKKRLM